MCKPLVVVVAHAEITEFLIFSLIFLTSDGQTKPVIPVRETVFCAVQLLWDSYHFILVLGTAWGYVLTVFWIESANCNIILSNFKLLCDLHCVFF